MVRVNSRTTKQAETDGEHTVGHFECPACDRARTLSLSRITPCLVFAEASSLWLGSRTLSTTAPLGSSARFIRKTTEVSYRQYIESLNLFFGTLQLDQIHLGHLRTYQEARITGAEPFVRKRRPNKNVEAAPCPASPKKCNQELSILKMILRRAGVWSLELDEYYEPFSEDVSDVPRCLSIDEQKKWLDVALLRQEWWIVYWYSVLAFETSMSTNEIRALRIGDVNLFHGIVNVPAAGAKNPYRARTIPLYSAEVKWAMEQLLARARDLGAAAPQHFLFPFRRPPKAFDPTKPMTVSGIKRQWQEVRMASGLKWFRPYDTRHTAITRWAEGGINIAEIMSMAGHMTPRMTRHYTHVSEQAKRSALAKLAPKKGPQSDNEWRPAPFYVTARVG